MIRTCIRAFALLLPLLAAGEAGAVSLPPLHFSTGGNTQVVTTSEYDLVDGDDHLLMLRLAAGTHLNVPFGVLDVDLAFQTGTTAARLHQGPITSLWLRGGALSGTWRLTGRFIEPFARAGVSYDWATLAVELTPELSHRASAAGAEAGLGVQVPLVMTRRGNVRHRWLTLEAGLGYAVRQSFDFGKLAAEETDDTGAVARSAVDVGTLDLSGITYRLGLLLRL